MKYIVNPVTGDYESTSFKNVIEIGLQLGGSSNFLKALTKFEI